MAPRLAAVLLAGALAAAAASSAPRCVHDSLAVPRRVVAQQSYPGRRLGDAALAPLRIKTVYPSDWRGVTGGAQLSDAQAALLQSVVVPAVVAKWATLLSLTPVAGRLYAAPRCTSAYTINGVYKCASYATSATQCFISEGGASAYTFAAADFGSYPVTNGQGVTSTVPAGSGGWADADFVMLIYAQATESCAVASGGSCGTLAYAFTCQTDQNDRPSIGRAQFCPCAINPADASSSSVLAGVALHEFAHALGFSASAWPFHRNADGTPKTPRDVSQNGSPPSRTVQFSCGGSTTPEYLPATSTAAFFSERGMTDCSLQGTGTWSKATTDCVGKLTGPASVAAAAAHFACPTINGAELENYHTTECDGPLGSHWEQRILRSELMGSYAQAKHLISALTLASFEDSGWYKPRYEAADAWTPGVDWGFQQGCAFALNKCVDPVSGAVTGTPPHFHAATANVCSLDRAGEATVTIGTGFTFPSQYRYFSSDATKGVDVDATFLEPTMDYCPTAVVYSNRMCSNASGTSVSFTKALGEIMGASSMCFTSTARQPNFSSTQESKAACYAAACIDGTLSITLAKPDGTTASVSCGASDAGSVTTPPGGWTGGVTCPPAPGVCAAPVVALPAGYVATTGGSATASPSAAPTTTAATSSATGSPFASYDKSSSPSPSSSGSPFASYDKSKSPSPSATRSAAGSPTASPSATATLPAPSSWPAAAPTPAACADANAAAAAAAACTAVSALTLTLVVPAYAPALLDKSSAAFNALAGALQAALADATGVPLPGRPGDYVTFYAPGAAVPPPAHRRALAAATPCSAAIVMPVPATADGFGAASTSALAPAGSGASAPPPVATLAARCAVLFNADAATAPASVVAARGALAAAAAGATGQTLPAAGASFSVALPPATAAANPALAAVVAASISKFTPTAATPSSTSAGVAAIAGGAGAAAVALVAVVGVVVACRRRRAAASRVAAADAAARRQDEGAAVAGENAHYAHGKGGTGV